MIQLNYRDSKPIYEQIKDGLRKLVISNSLSADENCHRSGNLRRSLQSTEHDPESIPGLESEGYIYTVTGKGTFVAERKEVYDARAKELLTEFDEIVEELFFLSVKEKELVERMDNLAEGRWTNDTGKSSGKVF